MSDVAFLDASQLLRAYRDRERSPVEVTVALLERIEELEPVLNAWCHLDPERTLEAARASERRWRSGEPAGLLDGVPVAVKDLFLTEGWPTRRGSAAVEPDRAQDHDAPSVAAIRRHGAVLLGKTTTPELGWKGVTDSPSSGVTRNPWDPDRTPGGSSGGSAAALAAGTVPLALGTDGGGSIRIPASFAGVTGIKPTWGRVPVWPVGPFGGLGHAGPMARTTGDLALLLQVLAEPDHRDAGALLPDGVHYPSAVGTAIAGVRVAYSPTLGHVKVDPRVAAAVRAAVDVLDGLGAVVEEVDPGFADAAEIFAVLWSAGAAAAVVDVPPEHRPRMDPGLQRIVEIGEGHSAVEYLGAVTAGRDLSTRMSRFHQHHDVLVTPTTPIPAFGAGRDVPDGWPERDWPSWTPFTYPFNLSQQPAVSVPCGFTDDGLPVGLQIVCGRGDDALALRVANAFERANSFPSRRPALATGD